MKPGDHQDYFLSVYNETSNALLSRHRQRFVTARADATVVGAKIASESGVARKARLTVGSGPKDRSMQLLHGPAVSHEPKSEPVEQLWVRGHRAVRTKVTGRGDDPGAEVVVLAADAFTQAQ